MVRNPSHIRDMVHQVPVDGRVDLPLVDDRVLLHAIECRGIVLVVHDDVLLVTLDCEDLLALAFVNQRALDRHRGLPEEKVGIFDTAPVLWRQ